MRLRNVTGSREIIAGSRFVVQEPFAHKGRWSTVFGNTNPICIEIGMGKGQFITTLAAQNPQINYIGIEKYSTVLLRAVQKMEVLELSNLKFIRMDAEDICEVFGTGEVAKLYLNFSDPWPKDRHGKGGSETDNPALFDFALEEITPAGWQVEAVTRDLHHDAVLNQGNIMTEYEQRFSEKGNPIYKYIIYR